MTLGEFQSTQIVKIYGNKRCGEKAKKSYKNLLLEDFCDSIVGVKCAAKVNDMIWNLAWLM